ncbi:hypothetical protein VTI74DRAFT_10217 [Chaetomium olivicolor]
MAGTPLMSALWGIASSPEDSRREIIDYLLRERRVDVNATGGFLGCALNVACCVASLGVVSLLLENGARADNAEDCMGRRPVHFACFRRSTSKQAAIMPQSAVPTRAKTERQQLLIAKYTTRGGMEDIRTIFDIDIVNDIFGVFDDVDNPMGWFDLFSDGWTLFNMGESRDKSEQMLQDMLNQMGDMQKALDQIRAEMEAHGATEEEINAKLDILMAQQAADTARILGSLNQVASMVSMMWANTGRLAIQDAAAARHYDYNGLQCSRALRLVSKD